MAKGIGIILEGGGVKGAYQVGALKALQEINFEISGYAGTSIGALNAALIAQGDYKKMINLWKDVSMNELIGIDEEEAFKSPRMLPEYLTSSLHTYKVWSWDL